MLGKQPAITALVFARRFRSGGFSAGQLRVADQHVDGPVRHIKLDPVAGLYQRQRATDKGFRTKWRFPV
jgi:hypothetical protein